MTTTPPRQAPMRRQRGAALLTAMVIVALVATLSASMIWQQWRAVQVETAERSRMQSAWILAGALDWARLILREDARPNNGNANVDHLGEPWAVPLAEARLSTFLASASENEANTEDAPDAFLSGAITDAQSRLNLKGLVNPLRVVDPLELAALQRLCGALGISADVATRIAVGLQQATPPLAADGSASGASAPGAAAPAAPTATTTLPFDAVTAPLMPRSLAQFSWFGIEPEVLRALEPYVVLLPEATTVNANTAPREVLVAAVPGLDLATAERMVQGRQRTPFKSLADMRAMTGLAESAFARTWFNSSYFEVRGRLRLADIVLEQRSLVHRRGTQVQTVQRERISSRDAFGS